MPRKITILGSTGSVGVSTLQVLALQRDSFEIYALTAHNNVAVLLEQCKTWHPRFAVVKNATLAEQLQQQLQAEKIKTEVLHGTASLCQVVTASDVNEVMAAIVGAAGLMPTLAAAKAGKRIYLANKEALVVSGEIFMQELQNSGSVIVPIDSEHNALFQCMPAGYRPGKCPDGVKNIVLTASGGPFINTPLQQFATLSPEQACAHPNWVMGRKISVDSATMMNKALEVIEAHWLFALPTTQIKVLLHPQSIVHSLVEYIDGSFLAQLGNPDMRIPIAHALAWPERMPSGVDGLDLLTSGSLEFKAVEDQRFPCMKFAYQVLDAADTSSAVLNAANEVAVAAFLDKQLQFDQIHTVIDATLNNTEKHSAVDLDTVIAADVQARIVAQQQINSLPERRAC